MTLQQGDVLNNRYRIVSLIGQGGFGAVYRAWDLRMNGVCVVKENLESTPESTSQFQREAQILFRLRHSGLPRVTDFFEIPGQGLYLVMDYIEGQNLEDIAASLGGKITEEDAVKWISQVCEALEYLHGQTPPIIHRDIKPQNIIITPQGEAVLVDFGVAKVYQAHQKTTIGARAVTPGFSPPEQYLQTGTDERSDIYSLGATLYALLTGVTPPESVARYSSDALPTAHEVVSEISIQVSQSLEKAMKLNAAERYQNVKAFHQAIQEKKKATASSVISKPVVMPAKPVHTTIRASSVAMSKQPARTTKRNSLPWLIGGGLIGILVIGFIILATTGFLSNLPFFSLSKPTEKKEATQTDIAETRLAVPVITEKSINKIKVCLVTDTAGIEDNSFNASAWEGMKRAKQDFGSEIKYLESTNITDIESNINTFIDDGCDLIITSGFLTADAASAAADNHPEKKFASIDVDWLTQPNIRGNGAQVDQATFLAGYLAAGMTKTGIVGTYTGITIPSTQLFMDGYAMGIQHYNNVHGTSIRLLGWDPAAQKGYETGNFSDLTDGYTMGMQLLDEGADIIMPVAGNVGQGTIQAMQERGTGLFIGVDSDWAATYPNNDGYVLASVLKRMDVFVYDTIEQVIKDNFIGGAPFIFTLGNNGVDLVYNPDARSTIPADLMQEIDQMKFSIIKGDVATLPTR
jgi:basic membrane protein A